MYNDDYKGDIVQKPKVIPKKKKGISFDKNIIIILFVIILIGAVYLGYARISNPNTTVSLEDSLITSAKEYIKNNNLSNNQEYFISASDLNVSLRADCSEITSGVFVNGNDYKSYLSCDDYETPMYNNESSYLTLNGKEVVFLAAGMEYAEPYYTFKGDKTGINIVMSGQVGTEEGVYNLIYNIMRYGSVLGRVYRKIVIINNDSIRSLYPTIKLNGNDISYLKLYGTYQDEGVFASDSVDGTIPKENIIINDNIVSSQEGEYKVVYTVVNSRGYASSVTRKILVANDSKEIVVGSLLSPSSVTNKDVNIILSVFGNNYNYIMLPDGTTTTDTTIKYLVTDNGTYDFKIYNKSNLYITKSVLVGNINRNKPTGNCKAEVYEKYVDITVNASSVNGLSSFMYSINGINSSFMPSTSYRMTTSALINSASVIAKDIIGNEQTFTCNIEIVDPTIGNNNVTFLTKFNKEYVIVNTPVSVTKFVSVINNTIAQNVDNAYNSSCLAFAQYHCCHLYRGKIDNMTAAAADTGIAGCSTEAHESANIQDILQIIFDEINKGKPVVIKVNSDSTRSSRHFVTVVGYRRGVYSGQLLKDTDLLTIDPWEGGIRDNSEDKDYSKRRTLWPQRGKYYVETIK